MLKRQNSCNNTSNNNNKLSYTIILTTFTCCQGGEHGQILNQWLFNVPCTKQINQIICFVNLSYIMLSRLEWVYRYMELGEHFLEFQKTVYLFPYPTQVDCWGETGYVCECLEPSFIFLLFPHKLFDLHCLLSSHWPGCWANSVD